MQLTDRDVDVLDTVCAVGFITTPQIRREHFPLDKDGSVVRDRLRKLEAAALLMRRKAEVTNPLQTGSMPVWIITEQGIAALAIKRNANHYYNQKPPCVRAWQNFAHYACVTDFALMLRRAIAKQSYVKLNAFHFEHTVVNAEADRPEDRYKLYTDVSPSMIPKKIVCSPDAAFEIEVAGHRRAYYLELERGFDSPTRVAARKTLGFIGLQNTEKWKLHFPEARDFRVLALTPSPGWRDSLRKEIGKKRDAAAQWMFIANNELTEDGLIHGDIAYTATEGPKALVRRPSP